MAGALSGCVQPPELPCRVSWGSHNIPEEWLSQQVARSRAVTRGGGQEG